ncbi:sensor histidine kinase [Microbacterium karelineae]|uniref:sensor histidine kinase n=1 Tax=Microbacterium karelineae TaxID=2654283 RepID=UPI0012E9952E|nr:histidine kinase [Microbacterium karelineae]
MSATETGEERDPGGSRRRRPSTLPSAADAARGPWDRFAWVLGIVWVVFMLFPISAASESSAPSIARGAGVALLVAYAVTYMAAYAWMIRSGDWRTAARRGGIGLAVMVSLMAAAAILVGPGALGAGAFLISIAMFAGPIIQALIVATAAFLGQYLVLTIVLASVPDGFAEFGVLYMPPAIVFVSVGCIRLITNAQEHHDEIDRQLSLVAERERVARDVHDVLGHSLTVVTVKAELAERLIDRDPERAKAEIAQVRSLSREALAEVRATVSGLRVARLADELVAARSALDGAGIRADVPESGDVVDPRRRIVVAWTLREAVTNVVRHARAARCEVRLASDGIIIEDDGIGIEWDDAASGLRGMRERAEAAGASLSVGPGEDGRGTRVEVRW